MIATSALITGGGDLPSIIQQSIAVGATAPAGEPVLSIVMPGGDSLTVQQGGDLAIYRAIGVDYFLFACGCQGEVVNEIPRAAHPVLMFNLLGEVHRIYRYGDTYYDFPGKGDHFIQFKAYITPQLNDKKRPFDPPPGLDHPCSNHDTPALIPEEYKEVVRKETPAPFRKPDSKLGGQVTAGHDRKPIDRGDDAQSCQATHAYAPEVDDLWQPIDESGEEFPIPSNEKGSPDSDD